VALAGRDGHFELNVTLPIIIYALHDAIHCLAQAATTFAERCVAGIEADEARCRELVGRSLMLVTALTPHLGYDAAAAVAKEALATGRTLSEVVLARKLLDPATLRRALNPRGMIHPQALGR
jgi:fumarate hydratase class II